MKLRDYLFKNQIKQTDFAELVGTTAATICRICAGENIPRKRLIKEIIAATNGQVSVAVLCNISFENTDQITCNNNPEAQQIEI